MVSIESSYKGKGFKANSEQINAQENILRQKTFCRCLSVRLFVCPDVFPDVCSLTTPTFFDRFVHEWYLWNPHINGKVLKLIQRK